VPIFKIYVGNIGYAATTDAVRRLFEPFGEVADVAVAQDKETGKPRGFAIVMMREEAAGKAAINALKGKKWEGRAIIINEAAKKRKKKKNGAGPQVVKLPDGRIRRRGPRVPEGFRGVWSDGQQYGGYGSGLGDERGPRRPGGRPGGRQENPRRGPRP
jgi:cold-inducible RNA-binding protein